MADENTKDATKPAEKPVAKQPQKVQGIRAVWGRMVDPHTAIEFNVTPSELLKRTPWVDSQIQAGKLELCDI